MLLACTKREKCQAKKEASGGHVRNPYLMRISLRVYDVPSTVIRQK